jgi:hypothetical protein
MPMTVEAFEGMVANMPRDTPLAELLGVAVVYWSASLTGYIYLVPDVIGKKAAIVPASLKGRFPSGA